MYRIFSIWGGGGGGGHIIYWILHFSTSIRIITVENARLVSIAQHCASG